ncbi:hypothetical protein C8035_v011118 [Colletotrichum spinosum]|uniref:Uncharacterized protein n=1 Tax=Colletotrichum spinosum TaxID=1347390 RepID=A0A4R8PYX0_9PEZI|nr:hypothetical protein C8035_v011118 [Colletotrichum spinosum]
MELNKNEDTTNTAETGKDSAIVNEPSPGSGSNKNTAAEGKSTVEKPRPNGHLSGYISRTTQRPRRHRGVPQKKPVVASLLETANDDEYDDAWLPEYGDGPDREKILEEEWVEIVKPPPRR